MTEAVPVLVAIINNLHGRNYQRTTADVPPEKALVRFDHLGGDLPVLSLAKRDCLTLESRSLESANTRHGNPVGARKKLLPKGRGPGLLVRAGNIQDHLARSLFFQNHSFAEWLEDNPSFGYSYCEREKRDLDLRMFLHRRMDTK